MERIKLRDNTITTDQRLDAMVEWDEKNKEFPVSTPSLEPINKLWIPGPVLDQGMEGACVAFALTHALTTECHWPYIPQTQKLDGKFAKEKVYWQAQRQDPFPGGEYPGATPKMSGTSLLSVLKVLKDLGYIKGYTWGYGLQDLILGVGYNGPAVITIPWFDSMYNKDDFDLFLKPQGMVAGNHAIMVNGVNVKSKYFVLKNSWGPNYGKNGSCGITFTDLDTIFTHYPFQIVFIQTK